MGRYQVTCSNKRGSHNDPHERIQLIGQQGSWRRSEDNAIKRIESGRDTFYVSVNGRHVEVIVAVHNGRKYLKPNRTVTLRIIC